VALFFTSCEELLNTDSDIVSGLKTALTVGADSSVTILHASNGYLQDQAVKILLPPEAQIIYDNKDNSLLKAVGISGMIDDVIISMNRAAEDAASEAGPIFKESITSLSITDGLSILNGKNPAAQTKSTAFDSIAATQYLVSTTRSQLFDAFKPKINISLGKDLGLGFSAQSAWSSLTIEYNNVAKTTLGQFAGLEPVNSDLGVHVTNRALDGLFIKVGDQERSIRRDPFKWIGDIGKILQDVFAKK